MERYARFDLTEFSIYYTKEEEEPVLQMCVKNATAVAEV